MALVRESARRSEPGAEPPPDPSLRRRPAGPGCGLAGAR